VRVPIKIFPIFNPFAAQILLMVQNNTRQLTISTYRQQGISLMEKEKLFMLLLGATPKGRHIEQHDIYFGIAENLKDLVPSIIAYWPEANGKIHIDAWREVTMQDGCKISVVENAAGGQNSEKAGGAHKLFFINLGGYKPNEFEEFHYKMLAVGADKGEAINQAKQTVFYKHTGFKTAESHIDDKYGVDVDDIHAIEDILPAAIKEQYSIVISPAVGAATDETHLGYFKLDKL
jgi:hypothetical protein